MNFFLFGGGGVEIDPEIKVFAICASLYQQASSKRCLFYLLYHIKKLKILPTF